MEMLYDVKEKYRRKNKILFTRETLCLQELLTMLREQNHRASVMWAFVCVDEIVEELLLKYPDERRILDAVNLCKAWARGDVKMPVAKRAILNVHGIAKEIDNPYDIALIHAIGQGCSAVHVETHAIGLAMYELTAIVLKYGIDNCEAEVSSKISKYIEQLKICEQQVDKGDQKWAPFLMNDNTPNKEMELWKKE